MPVEGAVPLPDLRPHVPREVHKPAINPHKDETMHPSTFEYLKPTEAQIEQMARVRAAAATFAEALAAELPDGPDKTYAIRKHREVSMWANIAITRQPDGSPRS